jgi:outer membrane lipopolysaccharide assembly protein LptE/RlpB
MKKIFLIPVLALTTVLAACGAKLDGTYADEMGVSSYTFKSGKVVVSALGMGTEMDYKVEDNKVKIVSPQGTMVMNILADGSIEGPMGIKLVKQAEK